MRGKRFLIACLTCSMAIGQNSAALAGWQQDNGAWYWLKEDQTKLTGGWMKAEDGSRYYFAAAGKMLTGWQDIGGSRYYLNTAAAVSSVALKPYGAALTGWQWIDGRCYYFYPEDGRLAVSGSPEGIPVNAEGARLDGNGNVMTDFSQGYVTGGWQNIGGVWNWVKQDGSRLASCWFKDVSGDWYLLNGAGTMAVGWQTVGAGRYYLNNVPTTQNGNPTGKPYGAMLTGWRWIDGYCYYFDASGKLLTSTVQDGSHINGEGKWTDANGVVQKDESKGFTSDGIWQEKTTGGPGGPGGGGAPVAGGSAGGGGGSSSGGGGGSSSGGGGGSRSGRGGGSSSGGGGGSSSGGSGGSGTGGSGQESEDKLPYPTGDKTKDEAVKKVIEAFKAEHITEGMSDFEKEIEIIRYLVDTISYDWRNYQEDSIPTDSYTSYGALVKKIAVCDGYAKTFVNMAEACGLEAKRVSGTAFGGPHAWNRIKLDGQWYNVDVTGEDPIIEGKPNDIYGYEKLCNQYINVTDKQLDWDHQWDRDRYPEKATAEKYGLPVAVYYEITGEVDPTMYGDNWRRYLMKHPEIDEQYNGSYAHLEMYGPRLDDKSNYFTDLSKTAVEAYLKKQIAEGYKGFWLTAPQEGDLSWLKADWLAAHVGGNAKDWRIGNWRQPWKKDYYSFKVSYDGDMLLDETEMQQQFDAACAPDRANVAGNKEKALSYIQTELGKADKIAEKPKSLYVIYEGIAALATEWDIQQSEPYIKEAVCGEQKTVVLGGQSYLICRYDFQYKTLEEMVRAYGELEKDHSNLMASTDERGLEYLKKKVDQAFTGQDGVSATMIYTDSPSGTPWSSELSKYADKYGDQIYTDYIWESGKFVYDGNTYTVLTYMIEYYPPQKMMLASPSDAEEIEIDQ